LQKSTRVFVALALLACALSFLKFNHCVSTGWQSPDQYVHACYSDIPALFGERGLSDGQWAYGQGVDSVEYPVVTGVVMWAIAKVTPEKSATAYFYLNALLLSLLFIGTALILRRIKPEFAHLSLVAPAVIGSLFINWDMWAIISMLGAIYWFDKKRFEYSAVALGISISTKFMPIFLLFPILFIFWRRSELGKFVKFSAITLATFLVINLPVAITTPEGWWRFYDLNLNRGSDWGSIWYSLSALGIDLANLNYLSILLLLVGFAAVSIYLLELRSIPTLASTSFIVLATVMCVSKVYSPQYVLWLVPLAVIALSSKKDLYAFWVWQGAEVIYHVAIWQHLATVTDAKFGLPLNLYALISLARIAATLYFVAVLVRRGLASGGQSLDSHRSLREFLFESADKYP
jgi:uncharacterized membrane protein